MARSSATILLVDDDSAFVRQVVEWFAPHELSVMTAETAAIARNLCEEMSPDLVIAELILPDGEPSDLIRELRRTRQGASIPIIVVTADEDAGHVEAAYNAGADDCMLKPVTEPALLARVHGMLRTAQIRDRLAQQSREISVLIDLGGLLAAAADPRSVLESAAQRIASVIPFSSCSIVVLSEDRRSGTVVSDTPDSTDLDIDLAIEEFPALAEVVAVGQPLVQEDADHDPLEVTLTQDDEDSEAEYGGFAMFPSIYEGRVQGVVISHLPPIALPVDQSQIQFGQLAAQILSSHLHKARQLARLHSVPSGDDVSGALHTTSGQEDLERRRLLANLVEHSADAIVAADMDGTILIFNRSAEKIFGYDRLEVIARGSVDDLYLPGCAREVMRIMRSPDLGEPGYVHNLQTEALSASGEIIPVSLSSAILYEGDEEVATVGIYHDLRQRLALETRLQEMAAQLVESEKQAALAALAGTAAHELNQPLTTIMGLVELLQMTAEEGTPLAEQLDRVYAETERMSGIVTRIGKITKFTTTRYVGETEILDLDKSSE